jgi:hypothetical protein
VTFVLKYNNESWDHGFYVYFNCLLSW